MQTTTDAYTAQVQTGAQPPSARLSVDWLKNGQPTDAYIGSATVQRTLTTDIPAEATLITGVSAATADIELAGDPSDNSKTATYLYSPFQQQAALFGVETEDAPATLELGQIVAGQPERFTVIKARARDLIVDASADGTAGSLQLVDGREDFRFTPTLPLVVAADATGGVQPGLNSQWIADAVFRQGGYYASPPPRTTPGPTFRKPFSATLHGSAAPDTLTPTVGTLISAATASGGQLQFQPVKWALGTAPDPVDGSAGTALYRGLDITYGGGFVVEMWIIPAAVSSSTGDLTIRDVASTTNTRIRIGRSSTNYVVQLADVVTVVGPAVVNPTQPHYLAVYLDLAGTPQITWRVDGVTTGPVTGAGSGLGAGVGQYECLLKTWNAIEALQISDAGTGATPSWNDAYVPNAALEKGENELVAMPRVDSSADAWSVLQQLASAEGAMALLDEPGLAQWWSRKHWGTAAAATTVQRTLRATVPLKAVSVQRLTARVRNVIRVAYTPITVRAAAVVWALTEYILVPARGTVTRIIDLSPDQAYAIDTSAGVIPSGGAMINGHSGWRAARNKDGTGGDLSAGLVMQITPLADSIKITWINQGSTPAWLVTPSTGYPAASVGQACSVLVGQLITSQAQAPDTGTTVGTGDSSTAIAETTWDPSITVYGRRVLSVDNNPFRQTGDAASGLGRAILHETAWPRPQLSSVSIVGDAALKIGDRVQLTDDFGDTGIDDPFWIVGKSDRYVGGDNATYDQELVLRPVASPGQLILGVTGRCELGGQNSRL